LPGPEITPGAKIVGAGTGAVSIAAVVILLARLDATKCANAAAVITEIAATRSGLWIMIFPCTSVHREE
jgi:hypothetical protein